MEKTEVDIFLEKAHSFHKCYEMYQKYFLAEKYEEANKIAPTVMGAITFFNYGKSIYRDYKFDPRLTEKFWERMTELAFSTDDWQEILYNTEIGSPIHKLASKKRVLTSTYFEEALDFYFDIYEEERLDREVIFSVMKLATNEEEALRVFDEIVDEGEEELERELIEDIKKFPITFDKWTSIFFAYKTFGYGSPIMETALEEMTKLKKTFYQKFTVCIINWTIRLES